MDVQHIDNHSKYTHCHYVKSEIPPTYTIAKADSGASNHYWRPNDVDSLQQLRNNKSGPQVKLPNNEIIRATQTGNINFSHCPLSNSGTKAHVLPNLKNASLISLGQLADDNCVTVLDKHEINIYKKVDRSKGESHYKKHIQPENKILSGPRNTNDGLWDIHVPSNTTTKSSTAEHQANAIIKKDTSKKELAQYLHATAGYPVLSTFNTAIKKGNFISWPGIESLSFTKHLPKSMQTSKGHLDQERKNLQSTQVPIKLEDSDLDLFPVSENPNQKTYLAAAKIVPFISTSKAYGDLTGRFPYISSRGNQYILVIYDHDSNAILAEPLKNKTGPEIKRGWMHINSILSKSGNAPKIYIIDNEASKDLKASLAKNDISYQLVPPHVHRRNAAERAIRTFKNHLLANLAGADPDFPVNEWDRLLPQLQITLNLLRNSRVNPALSSYAYLFGNFDFNRTPLAPVGTKVLSHSKPAQRRSWDYHGVQGWYIGPSMEHYRCVKCFFPTTGKTRDTDTVEFFPKEIPFPKTTSEDFLIQAATDILTLLQGPNQTLPILQYGDTTKNALVQLSQLLNRAAPAPPVPPSPSPVSPSVVFSPTIHPVVQPTSPPAKRPFQVPPSAHRATNPPTTQPPTPTPAPPRVQPTPPPRVQPIPLPRVNKQYQPILFPPTIPQQKSPYFNTVPMFYNIPTPRRQTLLPVGRSRLIQPPIQAPRFHYNQGTNFRRFAIQHVQAMHLFSKPSVNHVYDENGKRQTIDTLLKGTMKETWKIGLSNELGRLAQGVGTRVDGTDTIDFIKKSDVPNNKKVTYANFICDYRPLKRNLIESASQ